MPKKKSQQAENLSDSSVATLLDQRRRFPHKANLIDPELEKRPIEELTREKDRVEAELTKLDEELARLRVELKKIASSSEMQWWEQLAAGIPWWDLKRIAQVARDPRLSALQKQRDVLREVRKIGMRQNKLTTQISLLDRLMRGSDCLES